MCCCCCLLLPCLHCPPHPPQCQAEVRRLEGVQLQQMLDLINGRAQELRQLCADSHVAEPPGLSEALQEVNSGDRNPGAAADLLAKLFAMLGEVKVRLAGWLGRLAAGWGCLGGVQAAQRMLVLVYSWGAA